MKAEDLLLARDMGRLAHDPLKFVLYAYPWGKQGTPLEHMKGPQDWQREELEYIGQQLRADPYQHVRCATASGHGIGKSAFVGWIVDWGMATFPNTRIIVTANTAPQLRTKTWPEIHTWWQRCICGGWFNIEGLKMWYSAQAGYEQTWRADAVTWSVNNTEAFAGLHNLGKRIIIIFDEASAIDDRIWEVTEGALTDKQTEIIWLAFGNPTRNTGRFRDCFRKYRDKWKTWKIDSRNVEITDKEQLAEWAETYGVDSDFFKIRVRGEFPDAAAGQLISTTLVERAQSVVYKEDISQGAPVILGVDIAREGGDSCSVWRRQGLVAQRLYKTQKVNTMEFSVRLANILKEQQPDAAFLDMGNVGAAVYDNLKAWGFSNVFGIYFGGEAVDKRVYLNKRIEMWDSLRQWLEDGGCLPRGGTPEAQDIYEDLIAPDSFYNGKGLKQLEKKEEMKKRGLQSPDDGDALALTFAAPVVKESHAHAVGGRVKVNYDPF